MHSDKDLISPHDFDSISDNMLYYKALTLYKLGRFREALDICDTIYREYKIPVSLQQLDRLKYNLLIKMNIMEGALEFTRSVTTKSVGDSGLGHDVLKMLMSYIDGDSDVNSADDLLIKLESGFNEVNRSIDLHDKEILDQILMEVGKMDEFYTKVQNNEIKIGFKGNSLIELDLSNLGLNMLPSEIGKFMKLKVLEVKNNELTTLPGEIGDLKELEKLDVESNIIEYLPEAIGQLENLVEIDLGHNNLIYLPGNMRDLVNLRNLWLNSNKFTSLPDWIPHLKNLEGLCLIGNRIEALPTTVDEFSIPNFCMTHDLYDHILIIKDEYGDGMEKVERHKEDYG
jgi:hypothetical protein